MLPFSCINIRIKNKLNLGGAKSEMGKAKKRKVADFHKPKLKVGKRKPVGTNVTDTSFKTNAINIATQLEQTDDPKNKQNLSMKDLLAHLNHYNVTIRHKALLGFRDLFQRHPETMHEQVNSWLFKVLNKISDTDAAVRNSLQLCLNHVFGELSSNEMAPFVNVVVAHLCCGMTHINEGVQIDTLAILETMLEKYPQLFIPYNKKILTSLTGLVCKQGSKETSSSQTLNTSKVHKGISKLVNRDISINIEGKMSSLKARTKILEKLLNILHVIFKDPLTKESTEFSDENISTKTTYISAESDQMYVRIVRPENLHESSLEEWLSFLADDNTNKQGSSELQFMQDIYPVLLNAWVEYEPGQLASGLNDSSSLKASLPGMKNIVSILNIFILLVNRNQETNFFLLEGNYLKEFSTHFLHYFALPLIYKRIKRKSITKQDNTDALQQFAISFNFVIAKYLTRLLLQSLGLHNTMFGEKLKYRYLKQLGIFFMNVMDYNAFIGKERIQEFIEIFVDVISNLHSKLEEREWDLLQSSFVLSKMVICFSNASVTSPWKIPLLRLFHMICRDRNSCFTQHEFVKQLKLFIKNVIQDVWSYPRTSMDLVKASMQFVKQAAVYQMCEDEKVQQSLENTLIQITDSNGLYQHLPEPVFKTTIEIIYSMTSLSERLVRNIAFICHKQNVDATRTKYMISIMRLCLQKSTPSIHIEDFTNFILTVILNYTVSELKSMNCEKEKSMSWCLLNVFDDGKKELVADHAIKQFESLNGHDQLWNKIMTPIGNLLVMVRQLPMSTAIGILKLLNKIWAWKQLCSEDDDVSHTVNPQINQIADLLSGVLLYTVSERYKTTICMKSIRHENENEDDLLASAISLLSRHHVILRQLVKKWINLVREYDMDSACVLCIAEVIVALLHEPNLNEALRDLKSELISITNIQMSISTSRHEGFSIVQRLKALLSHMWT